MAPWLQQLSGASLSRLRDARAALLSQAFLPKCCACFHWLNGKLVPASRLASFDAVPQRGAGRESSSKFSRSSLSLPLLTPLGLQVESDLQLCEEYLKTSEQPSPRAITRPSAYGWF